MPMGAGERRATLAQVAALAGVSVMTASYTYNRPDRVAAATRARVLDAASRLGYAGPDPGARSLRRGASRTLGVVLGEHLSYAFDDPQAVAFLAGVADVCADRGYGLTILPVAGTADDARRVTDAAVDGFIVWTTSADDPALQAVLATKRPAVVQGGPALPGLVLVSVDDEAAAHAVGLAAFTGASRPAIVSQPLSRARHSAIIRGIDLENVPFPVTRHRLQGYRRAALERGTAWEEVQVAVCSRNDAAEAERMATTLLASADRPDAIAAMSDEQASGVVRAARAAGVAVPEELAVTGFDDAPVAARLGLTTVAQSLRDQGTTCALVALGDESQPLAAPWSVVRRSSTRS